MRLGFALAIFLTLGYQAETCLPPSDLSRIAAAFTNKVHQIRHARLIAAEFGYRVATYGGTSREVFRKICEEVKKEGKEKFEKKLADPDYEVRLIDFHKLNSDLDIILIRDVKAEKANASKAKEAIQEVFPGSILYKKMDINSADEFFREHPPDREHYEAVSNIPISDLGVESLPQLKVTLPNGHEVQLDRWGLEQISKQQFEFRYNPEFRDRTPAYGIARQALRWIRYPAEDRGFSQDEQSKKALATLIQELKGEHYEALIKLLDSGNSELRGNNKPKTLGGKLIDALEKLQLYSADSVESRKAIEASGFTTLLADAGILEQRLLVPIRPRDPSVPIEGKKKLGKRVIVRHYGPINAIQSMANGALYASNNITIIQGETTSDDTREVALYGAANNKSLGYKGNSNFVEITLSQNAIEGVDYVKSAASVISDEYAIKTLDAIERNPNGSLMVSEVNHDSLVNHSMESIIHSTDEKEIKFAQQSLADLLLPIENPNDAKRVFELAENAKKRGSRKAEARVLEAFCTKPEVVFEALFFANDERKTPEQKKLMAKALENPKITHVDIQFSYERNKGRFEKNPGARVLGIEKLVDLAAHENESWDLWAVSRNINTIMSPKRNTESVGQYLNVIARANPALKKSLRSNLYDRDFAFERVFFPERLRQAISADKRPDAESFCEMTDHDIWYLHPEIEKNIAELDTDPVAKDHGLQIFTNAIGNTEEADRKFSYARSIFEIIRPNIGSENFKSYCKIIQKFPLEEKQLFYDLLWDRNPHKVVRYAFGIFPAELARSDDPEVKTVLTDLQEDALAVVEGKRKLHKDVGESSSVLDVSKAMRSEAAIISKTPKYKEIYEGGEREARSKILDHTGISPKDQEAFLIQKYPQMSDSEKYYAIHKILGDRRLRTPTLLKVLIANSNPKQLAAMSYDTATFRKIYHQLDDATLHLWIERGGGPVAINFAEGMSHSHFYNPARTRHGFDKADTKIKARLAPYLSRMDEIAVASLSTLEPYEIAKIATHHGKAFKHLPRLSMAVAENMADTEIYRLFSNGGAETFWKTPQLIEIFLRRSPIYSLCSFYSELSEHPGLLNVMPDIRERFRSTFREALKRANEIDLRLATPYSPADKKALVFHDFPDLEEEFQRAKKHPAVQRGDVNVEKAVAPSSTESKGATPEAHIRTPAEYRSDTQAPRKMNIFRRSCAWLLSRFR